MIGLARTGTTLGFILISAFLPQQQSEKQQPSYPSIDYETASTHELKPHRRTIPVEGVRPGFNQLHLTLTVSPAGDVVDAKASGDRSEMEHWPELQDEARKWKFAPFEVNDKPATVEVEEYIDLVPPERLPTHHVNPPAIRSDSKVSITLSRSGCYGTCPSYSVTVSTDGVAFDGGGFVVASGKHTDKMDPDAVRDLARKFVAADFYSMDDRYFASVTDCPTYVLSISIDGQKKEVLDYVGQWEGMPAVIVDLQNEVDSFADTERWIKGSAGLVAALQAEKYNFKTFEAQVILKEASTRGQTETVQDLLEAGVPLKPIPTPNIKEPYEAVRFENVGWLTAAASYPDTLQVFIDADASKKDQQDKDLALVNAVRSGKVDAVRALIAYGANPNADLRKFTVTEGSFMSRSRPGAGSILIYAAQSGNPDMVREILSYHPDLEARDREGKTAIFAAGDAGYRDVEAARVECVRLLAQAGANVNARDNNGNTPLHEIFLTGVEEELLKLGADVNARNHDGETPIFTNVNNDSILLFLEHGADLTIRNNKGQTVTEVAKEKGPFRQKPLQEAIQKFNQH
jgi:ankyrin repeat protein